MRLKGYFFILTFFLIILGGVILYFGGWIYRPLLYGSEILIAFLLIYLILFYRKIIKPLDTIGSGMELLREQDFSSRLSLVGQYEADRVVNVFNRMMEQLKNERLRLPVSAYIPCSYSHYQIPSAQSLSPADLPVQYHNG